MCKNMLPTSTLHVRLRQEKSTDKATYTINFFHSSSKKKLVKLRIFIDNDIIYTNSMKCFYFKQSIFTIFNRPVNRTRAITSKSLLIYEALDESLIRSTSSFSFLMARSMKTKKSAPSSPWSTSEISA